VTPRRPDPEELARFLRQRQEIGEDSLFFDAATREGVLEYARGLVRQGAPAHPVTDVASAAPRGSGAVAPASRSSAAAVPDGALEAMDYEALREAALACTRCRLADSRTNVVFSDGNPNARLAVVGEAPGANEDETGLPFVGQAGKLLDLLLASIGLSRRESVYICNVLKCRPPANRNPMPDEIELCAPYLRRQIALVKPEVILAVGTFSAQLLTGHNRPLGKLRGDIYSYEGVPLIVTYHPAALLRNAGWTRATWDDLQLLRQVMDGS
jgi:DNA polymerase